jgi:hypothetical protein
LDKIMSLSARIIRQLPFVGRSVQCVLERLDRNSKAIADVEKQLQDASRRPVTRLEIEANLRIADNSFLHDTVVVLGSGPSISETAPAVRSTIAKLPTIAMNRYTLFWEDIGIWPSYVFLADSLGVGPRVFVETCKVIADLNSAPSPVLLLEAYYQLCVPPSIESLFFVRDDRNGDTLEWAESLREPMFFQRGSLSSLMNLIYASRLAKNVVLIGVDLNRPGAFYDVHSDSRPDLFNAWDQEAAKLGKHATAVSVNGWSGSVLDNWKIITNNFQRMGITISSLSATSELVESGHCPATSAADLDRMAAAVDSSY